jgi:hypothetical protein
MKNGVDREFTVPGYLSHYYEAEKGSFLNLSHVSLPDAEAMLDVIRRCGNVFASQRSPDYLQIRRELESRVRELFIAKGGKPELERPHYMILGSCPWLLDWYVEGRELQIPLDRFALEAVSFTYGDTFPAMRYPDGKPYRRQVYTLAELPTLVLKHGLPQEWNSDGSLGPDRYIEAQVWSDQPVKAYLPAGR